MTSREVPLHIEDAGTGAPVIVFVHGFGGSARNFRGQVRALRERHRVLSYDARGHARSRVPAPLAASMDDANDYSLDALADDLGRVAAGVHGAPLVIVGLSLGAVTALRYALRGDDSLVGLVLTSFPAPGDRSPQSWASRLADAIDADGLDAAGQRLVWGGGRFDAASAQFIRQGFLEHDPRAVSALARHALVAVPDPASLATDLAALKCRTLLIAGDQDAPARVSGEILARSLRSVRVEVVPECGHLVNLQKPIEFNGLLTEFLNEF